MRFSCTQENLRTALSLIGHIAARQGSLPILSNVLIRAESKVITLIATNLELAMTYQLRGKVEEDGTFTANAKLLTDVVNLLPKDRVDCVVSGSELELRCRGNATKVRGMDAAEFPLVPEVKQEGGIRVAVEALRDALASTVFAAASGESRPELGGTLWKFDGVEATIAATDSYRLGERKLALLANSGQKGTAIIVPSRTVTELLRILGTTQDDEGGEVALYPSASQLLVVVGSLEVTSRLVDGTFPDYSQIIPRSWTTRVRIPRGELQTAVRAASLFARMGVNDVHLRCLPKANSSRGASAEWGQLIIRSENAQLGEHQASLDAEVEGDEVTTILNARYLLDGLAVLAGDRATIELTSAAAPVMLKPEGREDYLYIVMPIKQ